VALGVLLGILTGISLDIATGDKQVIAEAKAEELVVVVEPQEVMIEIRYDWDKERIIEEIEKAFPEDPKTAVKVAKCESGLIVDIQSNHILDYGREKSWGLFQIHEPAWDKKAKQLGYEDYKTSPRDNIDMARWIYEQSGKKWTAWSCWSKKMI